MKVAAGVGPGGHPLAGELFLPPHTLPLGPEAHSGDWSYQGSARDPTSRQGEGTGPWLLRGLHNGRMTLHAAAYRAKGQASWKGAIQDLHRNRACSAKETNT